MNSQRMGWTVSLALGVVVSAMAGETCAASSVRPVDPARVVPLEMMAPEHRENVAEVIRDHTFYRKGAPETFPCDSKVYLSLVNEPAVTLALWKDLAKSEVRLRQTSADRYEGSDGNGASATWEFAYRSAKLHVMLCNLNYKSPRGATKVDARIVLVVHSGFYKEVNGDQWVQHDIEAFVKIDSKGWKTLARTVRPMVEKVLEDQVREAGWFVSLMGRLVATYPNWACQVAMEQGEIADETRAKFRDAVVAAKRPGASTGRPAVADNSAKSAVRTR